MASKSGESNNIKQRPSPSPSPTRLRSPSPLIFNPQGFTTLPDKRNTPVVVPIPRKNKISKKIDIFASQKRREQTQKRREQKEYEQKFREIQSAIKNGKLQDKKNELLEKQYENGLLIIKRDINQAQKELNQARSIGGLRTQAKKTKIDKLKSALNYLFNAVLSSFY